MSLATETVDITLKAYNNSISNYPTLIRLHDTLRQALDLQNQYVATILWEI
jgi:hypothetical protein